MILKFKNTDQSDEAFLKAYVATANQELLGQLYSRYIPLVYGICLKYLQHQQDAEDSVMLIYEELIEKCKNRLYTVSKNHCLQIIRKTKPQFYEEINNQVVETEPFLHLFDESDDEDKQKALSYCLDGLPKEQLKCIRSFFFEDSSYADIVLMTGYTLNKVKSYIQNGKRNLRMCMVKVLNIK
jgi:RNA polymerase sigma-70 factor (ECF subfamily)